MNTKNLALGTAVIALTLWGLSPTTSKRPNRTLAKAFPAGLLESPASCTTPEWPNEARRYEVDGITVLNFQIGADGSIEDATVARSSGWKLLDDAAVRSLVKCKFKPNLDEHVRTATYPIQFVWTLTGPPAIRPQLTEGSCTPSKAIAGFDGYKRDATGPDGLLVRFLIDAEGTPFGIKAETDNLQASPVQPKLITQALDYLASCKFTADPAIPGERTDTMFGRVRFTTK